MEKVGLAAIAAALLGCASGSSYVHTDAALGRVVVYKNGIAYFERRAHVEGDTLRLSVPSDKVDDFLKSLSVVEEKSGEAPPIAYTRRDADSVVDLDLRLSGEGPHDLLLSYVTEMPAWKPTYRLTVGEGGEVTMQGWAIVDNASAEDWRGVKLAVGSSSALSFRYDLASPRNVARETLRADDLFAQAPPIGGAPHGEVEFRKERLAVDLADDALGDLRRTAEADRGEGSGKKPKVSHATSPGGTGEYHYEFNDDPTSAGPGSADASIRVQRKPPAMPPSLDKKGSSGGGRARALLVPPPDSPIDRVAGVLKSSGKSVVVEGYAAESDADKDAASLERANRVRDALVRRGADPSRVVAVGRGASDKRRGGVSIVEAPAKDPAPASATEPLDPIGAAHFESARAMDVPKGTSAMVAILSRKTEGEIVYLYDPESARGNATFPFRSVRLKNPTGSTLESGPVTVYGRGAFVGEGLAEPIPAGSVGFVPFALDRQVVVDRDEAERDEILRVVTVQRGVLSAETQHVRRMKVVLTNRSTERVAVYVRHSVAAGFRLLSPARSDERLGTAHLFRVAIEPSSRAELVIEEATPVLKTVDLRSPRDLDMVKVFLSSSVAGPELRAAVEVLVRLHQDAANLEQEIGTTREQIEAFRARTTELGTQIAALRSVKTGGDVMRELEKTLQTMSARLSEATLKLAALEDRLLIARIKFQDGVAGLSLEGAGGSGKQAAAGG